MSVSSQSRTRRSEVEGCLCSVAYQPKSRLLILEFPRDGAYLYHNVPVSTYEMLQHSPVVRASFVKGRRHNYSVVTTA
jgi:hypothetical protein